MPHRDAAQRVDGRRRERTRLLGAIGLRLTILLRLGGGIDQPRQRGARGGMLQKIAS